MAGFDMKDYVDVAERIAEFSAKYPEGSLQSDLTPLEKDGVLVGWLCRAYAYRTPSDERPGIGHAVEPVPGKTPYTRDSEAMNSETSAWGRAIIALGFKTKKIASKQELEARQDSGAAKAEGTPKKAAAGKAVEATDATAQPAAATNGKVPRDPKYASEDQTSRLWAIAKEQKVDEPTLRKILKKVTGQESGGAIPKHLYDAVVLAVESYQLASVLADGDVPFE